MSHLGLYVTPEEPLGKYREAFLARSTSEEIRRRKVGSGGAVTSILMYMLEKGYVDSVIAAKKVKGLKGELVVARTREELLEAAGNRWSVLPFTSKLRSVLEDPTINKVAIVGLPCQAQFLYQMKVFPLLETDFTSKVFIVISLFCIGTFATEALLDMLRVRYGLDPSSIESIRMGKGELVVIHSSGERRIPLEDVLPFMQTGCLVCPDYTGVFADISAGVSENMPGYTLLLVRSDLGARIVKEAADAGFIELTKASPDIIEEVRTKAEGKIARAIKYMSILL